ncbi:MAG: argininosuccinate lyase [Thermoanaerobacter sp.]|nr:argininosuccinate lyase [Thermoanaerobacter sp.]
MSLIGDYRNGEVKKFPGKKYVKAVLEPTYDVAKRYLIGPMLNINKAHLVMLKEKGIISSKDAAAIARAVEEIDIEAISRSSYDEKYEDLFFVVEGIIIEKAGQAGGNLHIARSRNDMGVTMYRMVIRELLLKFIASVQMLKKSLLFMADKHKESVMLAYTHTQQAQPTTLGHYLLAVYDQLSRDEARLRAAYRTVNKSPMGAAAITTSGFNIDRQMMAKLLGFDGIIENSYDAIAGGDYLTETASALKLTCIHTGRFVHDLLLWATQEFDFVRIADPYVQISSIMPQKRNPVGVEHVRSLLSAVTATAEAAIYMQHNTPFGDIVDTEDDAQPLLWEAIEKGSLIFSLLADIVVTADFNTSKMEAIAKESFATVTELADVLVREKGIPFRTAHHLVSNMVREALSNGLKPSDVSAAMLDQVSIKETGTFIGISEETFRKALDPLYFVKVRKVTGGPALCEVERMLKERKETLFADEKWLEDANNKLDDAKQMLDEKFRVLKGGI